jgi:hypothetical protein
MRQDQSQLYTRISYRTVNKTSGICSDQTIMLRGPQTLKDYAVPLRCISYYDAETNNFMLDAILIAKLYKCRRQIEMVLQMAQTKSAHHKKPSKHKYGLSSASMP